MSRDLATPCPSRPSPRQPAGLYHVIGNVWEWTHDYWTTRHRRSQEPRKARPGHVRDPSMTRPKGAARRCSRTRVGQAGRPGRRVRCPTASRRAAPSSATPRTASATASPRARKTPRTRAHHSCARTRRRVRRRRRLTRAACRDSRHVQPRHPLRPIGAAARERKGGALSVLKFVSDRIHFVV